MTAVPGLYETALGDAWAELSSAHQAFHTYAEDCTYTGVAEITRGTGPVAALAAAVFGFPRTGEDVSVTLEKSRQGTEETWSRSFGGRPMRSVCYPSGRPSHSRERLWPCVFEMELQVQNQAMHLHVRRGWMFGVPLPRFLLPKVDAREFIEDHRFNFDIAIRAPLTSGLLVHYRGWLRPDD
ncbi:MAG: DUF4166 domain-containing protein [Pseudomonadota bacterium]